MRAAIRSLARVADEGGARPSQLVHATEAVVEAHPKFGAKVGDFLQRRGGKAAMALTTGLTTATGKQLVLH